MTYMIPLVLSLFAGLTGSNTSINNRNTINAAIGDVSYSAKYGELPTGTANETDRIKTHLEYVERILRSKDVSHLTDAAKRNRIQAIELLHEYRVAGNFPSNYDHPSRRPCFIDKDGNICAVGYLVEQTAGRDLAERISAKHKYDYIEDINMPELTAWVSASGLTKEECAMIQPAYGYRYYPPQPQISTSNAVTSSVFTGANVAFTGMNIYQTINGKRSTTPGLIALASGAAQTMYGGFTLTDRNYNSKKEKTAAIVNLAVGGTTVLTSLVNLVVDKRLASKNTTVSVGSFNTIRNEPTMGFTLVRKL